MAKMKMWNYLIAFGMILASLWIAADKSTPLGRGRGVVQPNRALHAALISRLKIMADMNIAERFIPQDGHIEFMGNTGKIPVMNRLGQWNLALGMAVIATSFAFATKWE